MNQQATREGKTWPQRHCFSIALMFSKASEDKALHQEVSAPTVVSSLGCHVEREESGVCLCGCMFMCALRQMKEKL